MKKISLFVAFSFCVVGLSIPPATPPAAPATPAIPAPVYAPVHTGIFLAPSVGVDISEYSVTGLGGGLGFGGQIIAQYFFLPNMGAYLGTGLVARKMQFNSSGHPLFLDIPFGAIFQYSLSPSVVNVIGLGVYYSFPFSSFDDSGGAIPLRGTLGLDILMSTYFPVVEKFELGMNGNLRLSFSSPFSGSPNSSVLSLQVGFSGRVRL